MYSSVYSNVDVPITRQAPAVLYLWDASIAFLLSFNTAVPDGLRKTIIINK